MTRSVERYATSGAKAERALTTALTERSRVHGSDDISADTLLADLAQAWLARRRKDDLAESSLALYEQTVTTHITPALGKVRVREATVGLLERFLDTKTGSVAKRCRIVLVGMMMLAVQHGAIERNPVRETTPRKSAGKAPRALTADELAILRGRIAAYSGSNGHGPPRAADLPDLFEVFLGVGGRIAEMLPAQWSDLALAEPPTLTLHRTKGGDNDLVVVLPAFAVAALRRQKARDLPSGLIFPSRAGTPRSPANVRRQLREARQNVVLDAQGNADGPADMFDWVTPHTLRRTVGTVVADEYGTEVAAEQLGNTREVLERHYRERRAQARDVTSALDTLAPVRVV
ncbi:site-specific integrase [Gordonia caeni]|uniref:site-specific integrase n=1 Tax=Gordonia caeni TaxID=1007097 RepID=UPI0031D344F3